MPGSIKQYFKKILDDGILILVRMDPDTYEGLELIVLPNRTVKKTERQFDETIYEELNFDDFSKGNALEFNLYLKGFTK